MIGLLVTILIWVLVFGLIAAVISWMPISYRFKQIGYIILAIIAIIALLSLLTGGLGGLSTGVDLSSLTTTPPTPYLLAA